jgi:hypothetical protein
MRRHWVIPTACGWQCLGQPAWNGSKLRRA